MPHVDPWIIRREAAKDELTVFLEVGEVGGENAPAFLTRTRLPASQSAHKRLTTGLEESSKPVVGRE